MVLSKGIRLYLYLKMAQQWLCCGQWGTRIEVGRSVLVELPLYSCEKVWVQVLLKVEGYGIYLGVK